MSWFCKHEWDYVKAHTEPKQKVSETEKGGKFLYQTMKCGVSVYCKKCGKINYRLSRKLSKLYAVHLGNGIRYGILEKSEKKSKDLIETIQVDMDVLKEKQNVKN